MLPLRTIKKGGIAKTSSKKHVYKLDIVNFVAVEVTVF